MLEAWEIFLGIIMILLLAFPLRTLFIRNLKTIIGFAIGIVAGRIFYFYLAHFFGFESEIVKIVVVLISGAVFSEAFMEFIQKVFPK